MWTLKHNFEQTWIHEILICFWKTDGHCSCLSCPRVVPLVALSLSLSLSLQATCTRHLCVQARTHTPIQLEYFINLLYHLSFSFLLFLEIANTNWRAQYITYTFIVSPIKIKLNKSSHYFLITCSCLWYRPTGSIQYMNIFFRWMNKFIIRDRKFWNAKGSNNPNTLSFNQASSKTHSQLNIWKSTS